ncbi:MAG: ATP-dependent helicase HrpB [Xanthomonadaceae bacterium]|nr:ATP-dependent helicase HrpB [Xanthomonadaceae bacterium]MDP2186175.1 ATP-dependent helicase HrpB [Xanthomonadales bacterium]MDZ4114895.1 ATP-dependent helicase HrpB [Xanthomonadaceae bacterium]MDZ4377487.1 ATP-dependent helicase HrpB [Xanthomonadaceae bacterium]
MSATQFPIDGLLPQVLDSLAVHPRLVLEAPPGAGKTTQVPPALLNATWRGDGRIIMLEPRRVAARAAAGYMASARGEAVGASVGYRIRFENKVSAATRIEVVTEGILTRMIQADPTLDGVAALIFDEFHERHLAGDLGLALALDVQAQLRPELRIVLMSATLDGERLAAFLDAPRLSSAGRSFPVQVNHFPSRREEAELAQLRRCIEHALNQHSGDLLVFLPGQREIAQTQATLSHLADDDVLVLPLHGELAIDAQSAALHSDSQGRRRVVLATNVAESSVTLPGVRVVIDSGLAREPRYDPNSGFSRLSTVSISQASADQRAGRAGRVAEGWCYRLWPASLRLEPARTPEIAQVELAPLALELAAWGSAALRFPDPPPVGALAAGRDLLQRLGALDTDVRITAFGRSVLELGTHPRLAAMLHAANGDERALACDLAALVEARDPLRSRSDALAARWQALAAFRSGRAPGDASRGALAAIDQAATQWRRRLRCSAAPPGSVPVHAFGDLLAHAFPDRIAHQHPGDPRRYQLANGRSARLFDDSAVFGEPWLVIVELRHDAREALILRATPVDATRLQRDFPQQFVEHDTVRWDASARALVARRERCFDRIVLDSRPAGRPDPTQAAQALCDAVGELGLDVLPWTEALTQWRARVRCLRDWMPELDLPDLSDEALQVTRERWLQPAFIGKTRLDALSEDELGEALRSNLDWAARQRIDQLAPRRISVPSGQERAIAYAQGSAPVLAVKLQELFGLADTPRIADGRIALTLHLLSPGGKPLQITQDLRSFWQRTYPEVKKEMKGRYPRHPWPDDPWTATPTHRAKPRGT